MMRNDAIGGAITGQPISDPDSGFTYEPLQGGKGQMGYRVTAPTGEVSYFYLNPSGGSDDGVPTIFVYHDDPEAAYPVNSLHYYVPETREPS